MTLIDGCIGYTRSWVAHDTFSSVSLNICCRPLLCLLVQVYNARSVVGTGLLAPRLHVRIGSDPLWIELLVEKSRTHSKQAFDGWETHSRRATMTTPTETCNTCTTSRLRSIRTVLVAEIFADPSNPCHCCSRAAGPGHHTTAAAEQEQQRISGRPNGPAAHRLRQPCQLAIAITPIAIPIRSRTGSSDGNVCPPLPKTEMS